jgi:hypothetical protein
MPKRLLMDDDRLIAMHEAGYTHKEIAEASFKLTGNKVRDSTVSRALARLGRSEKIRYDDTLPWTLPDLNGHGNSKIAQMLRAQGRRARGIPLSEKTRLALDAWEEEMDADRKVVEYIYIDDVQDPDDAGFRYRHWQPADGDNWVRADPLPLGTTRPVDYPVDRRSKYLDPEPMIQQREPESVWAGGLFSGIGA